MLRLPHTLLAAVALFGALPAARAQPSISVIGSPSLTVSSANAGFQPTPVTDASASYSVTTDAANQKVVARLAIELPQGLTLQVTMNGSGGPSQVPLGTTDVVVIPPIALPGTLNGTITYRVVATVQATPGTVAPQPQVTFSVVPGP